MYILKAILRTKTIHRQCLVKDINLKNILIKSLLTYLVWWADEWRSVYELLMPTDKGLFDAVHNPIGCIHSQVAPQTTKVHFKGTPFLLFYVQWPVLLRRRIHIHYIRSKHHKQLGTPVPPQMDCGYQPCSISSPTALCPATLCHEVQRWLARQHVHL